MEADHRTNPNSGEAFGTDTEVLNFEGLADESLIELLKCGQNGAMTPLYRRYSRLLGSIAYGILNDRAEAEEIVQEVFFEAYRKISQYDPAKGRGKIWLMRLAYTASLDRRKYLDFRKHYDQPSPASPKHNGNANGHEPYYRPDPLLGLTLEQRRRRIEVALSALPEKQKNVLTLAFLGLSSKDIAAQMNETHANVRTSFYRGLRKLREIVGREPKATRGDAAGATRGNNSLRAARIL